MILVRVEVARNTNAVVEHKDSVSDSFSPSFMVKRIFLLALHALMNFIIRMLCYLTTTCSSVKSFEATCGSEVVVFSHYEIHAS